MLLVMRWGLGVTCLVAACSGQGVDLEVTSEVPIDRVELFFANDHCYKDDGTLCDGVAWETQQPRPPGDVYVMKGDENVVYTQRFDGERAVMHLEATSEFREPKLLAIVGFSNDVAVSYATMWGPRIPANSAETWQVQLKFAGPGKPSYTTPPEPGERFERVQAWKRERVDNPDELSRCLAMQVWDETAHEWNGTFIVPASDPDCDGRLVECDPLHANYNVGGGPTACVTTLSSFGQMPCVLGASLCEDGVRANGACLAATSQLQCMPQEICTACMGDPAVVACAVTAAKSNPDVSAVKCTFNGSDAGNTCGQGFNGSYTQIVLPVECSKIEVRPITAPLTPNPVPDIAMVGNVTIHVTRGSVSSGTCAIDLNWTGGTGQPGDAAQFVFIVTGTTTPNTLVLPVRIELGPVVTTCTNTASEPKPCTASATLDTDSMFSCLAP
jgi:hypothetical protein